MNILGNFGVHIQKMFHRWGNIFVSLVFSSSITLARAVLVAHDSPKTYFNTFFGFSFNLSLVYILFDNVETYESIFVILQKDFSKL